MFYSRLQSMFVEKFRLGKFNRSLGKTIMKTYHQDLPQEVINKGAISFGDLVRYIQDGHNDDHWRGPYHLKCSPCIFDYDYVVKLETHDHDVPYIIKNKLSGRGLDTNVNMARGRPSTMLTSGRYLDLFSTLKKDQMQFLHKRFQVDLDMFGYSFDNKTLIAKCGYGKKCC